MGQTTTLVTHLLGGKVRLYRHNKNPMLYARAWLKGRGEKGKEVVYRTGETELRPAREVAEHWYMEQQERVRRGERLHGRQFAHVAEAFLNHADTHRKDEISDGQREQYRIKWNKLKPHLTDVKVTDVDAAFLMKLRDLLSQKTTQYGRAIKPTTLKKDMQVVRMVLNYARDWEKCISSIPPFPSFRGAYADVPEPIPFFTHDEWTKLRNAAKARYEEADLNPRVREQRFELYCFLMLCVGAALRVDEAYSLHWKHCERITLADADKTEAIQLSVLGKHKGKKSKQREHAWAIYGGVSAYELLKKARPDASQDDLLFVETHRDGMTELLEATGLRTTSDGRRRNAKSLRQTGISLRLELGENIDIRDIAKWARTTPEMIYRWYDQNHPQKSIARIVGFRSRPKARSKKQSRNRRSRR